MLVRALVVALRAYFVFCSIANKLASSHGTRFFISFLGASAAAAGVKEQTIIEFSNRNIYSMGPYFPKRFLDLYVALLSLPLDIDVYSPRVFFEEVNHVSLQ